MQFAAVFPGQGSQSHGMLSDLSESHVEVKQTFEEASEILGKDLWNLTQESSGDALNQTVNTQPLMLAAGVSVWKIWQKVGGCLPVGMAGHSLGEYSALVAGGAIDYADAVSVVAKRASLMQDAVPKGTGAMAAILGLDDDVIVKTCETASTEGVVEAVNFNSPGQVVIAGETNAVDKAIELLTDAGAKRAIKLPVSVPSHCSLMKPAAEALSRHLNDINIKQPEIPVIQNVSATHFDNQADIRSALTEQLYKPVLWVDCVNALNQQQGADSIIEFGPGKVLFGLNRRINRAIKSYQVSDMASLEKALEACDA